RADHVNEARAVLRQAAAQQPHSTIPWLALARLEEQEGEVDAAEQDYRQALAAENTPEANLRLAQFLVRSGRIPEAEALLQKVDREQPAQARALPDFELLSGRAERASQHYSAA